MVTYTSLVQGVASANIEELRGDLDQARHATRRARGDLEAHERRVAALEYLVELAEADTTSVEPVGMTLHEAMVHVLQVASYQMLRAGDLAAEINARRLYRMRDGRPVEAQQVHARVGQYPHLFTREGTFIKLASD